jgi:predicted Zn-dependent protease
MKHSETSRRRFLSAAGRCAFGIGIAPAAAAFLSGCQNMGQLAALGSSIAASAGVISQDQAGSITRAGYAVGKTFEDITPEQEYYIGRAISVQILDKYRPYKSRRSNHYVNVLGQTLAQASMLPETYGGYHFMILDSGDINALSAPGGFIFITRGLIRCCEDEDALASVLAHEIGHVQFRHGLRAIKTSRVTEALTIIGTEAAKSFGGQELSQLTKAFEGSINDITHTLIDSGYSRSLEYEADVGAVNIMNRIGYDPNGLVEMLNLMSERLVPGGNDFAATHPSPKKRISEVSSHIGKFHPVTRVAARQKRFKQALKAI